MITFETREEFESAVLAVLADKVAVDVEVGGYEMVRRVKVALRNRDDVPGNNLTYGQDSVY